MPILIHLMDDYFTLIHPLIPVPHEVSFRNAFNSGEATRNTTFLALLASMVGCVAAAYPQRPQQHSQALRVDNQAFPNHMSLVDRCFKVITQAQGDGYLDGPHLNVHDAQVSYLQGLTSAYTLKPQSSIHHFKQCIAILQRIGAHKASTYKYKGPVVGVPQARMTPNGETLQGPQPGQPDLVIEEVTKRTFWAMFVTARSIQQSGVSPWDLTIPPSNPLDPYPSLPLEIDDPFLMHDKVLPMPPGLLSATSGFNTSVRIFIAYNDLASIEAMIDLGNGINGREQATLLSRPITALQESIIKIKEGSLLQVQQLQQDLPPELSVNLTEHVLHSHNQNFPTLAPLLGVDTEPIDYSRPDERNRIALDVQKADIKHSIISTRLYLGR